MTFKDHFSGHSREYSAFRPRYPEPLFAQLADLCPARDKVWDCATGSGQAALGLAGHFTQVIATDASTNQISNAGTAPGIQYSVVPAEHSGIASESVDLITVAQALHWFDIDAFATETDRVLKRQGVLAVWSYWLANVSDRIDPIIAHFHNDIVGEYWAFDRKLVKHGYADVKMPFEEISLPAMEMTASWTFSDLIGYLDTWSAARAYQKARGRHPLELVHDDLLQAWGEPETVRSVSWPLMIRAWRKAGR